jgi:hypothetical protein
MQYVRALQFKIIRMSFDEYHGSMVSKYRLSANQDLDLGAFYVDLNQIRRWEISVSYQSVDAPHVNV